MKSVYFNVSSVTNAMRGKNLLEKNGMHSYIHRTVDEEGNNGCGYSLLVTGDDNKFAGMVWLQDLIGIDQYSSPVSSFLSDDYLSVRVDDSLSTVLEKVADYGEKDFGILPVLDAEGAIRGFLNRSSLLSTLSRRFIDEPVERDEQEGA